MVDKKSLNFIFFLGKPGAGKDTQATILTEQSPNAILRSTGDMYRGAKNNTGPYAKYHYLIKPYAEDIDAGRKLVPDEIIVAIVKEVILEDIKEGKTTFLYTGFPRTVIQLNLIEDMFQEMSGEFNINPNYICYPISDETARLRAHNRYENDVNKGLIPRKDDLPEAVENRLEVYREVTKPLLQRLCIEDRLIIIDGEKSISQVEMETSSKLLGIGGKERK